jgi:hypothetical protein
MDRSGGWHGGVGWGMVGEGDGDLVEGGGRVGVGWGCVTNKKLTLSARHK